MSAQKPVPIAGTHRNVWPGATAVSTLADGDVLLTAWLRPRTDHELDAGRARQLGATLPGNRAYASRADLARATDADPNDVDMLKTHCSKVGVGVLDTHWRSVTLSGPLAKLIEVFGATASIFELPDGRRFRHRSDSLHAPSEIAALLRGPFGIHQWPRSHAIGNLQEHTKPLSTSEVEAHYDFPDADGSGQTVGVVQLRGTFKPDDFKQCMAAQGRNAKLPIVKRVDNAELAHAEETEKDVESAIDTQIVGALAPGAQIIVYAAPDDERGVLDAVRAAIFDDENRPSILSISFGFPEHLWTPVALTVLDDLFTAAALLGVTIFCAAGDNGAELDASGNPHVLAPASSPFAHTCGGTQLSADASCTTESAWPKTGGGFSEAFEPPSWQNAVATSARAYRAAPGRGVPDFCAQVMPGYPVVFAGTSLAAGGTSAAAPMWSALIARVNQRIGARAGFIAPLLYANSARLFRDVTSGGNDRYQSTAGWNPCTGLGVPSGTALEAMLRGS
jgi:kumamolisin